MTFLNSILNNSKEHNDPFKHWEYNDALTKGSIEEIIKADIPDVSKNNLTYDGTRAIDGGAAEFREGIASGGQAIKFRCFVTKENVNTFPNLIKFINELRSKEVHETISKMIKKDWVKAQAVIIDVGINQVLDKGNKKVLVGDVDYSDVFSKVKAITPVPGGVGPMTIHCLLENTFKLSVLRRNLKYNF